VVCVVVGLYTGNSLTIGKAKSANISMESTPRNIIDTLIDAGNFTVFLKAAEVADLVETLKDMSNFTIFAPDDTAFKKLPAGYIDSLLKPENKSLLTTILHYHIVPFRITQRDLPGSKLTLRTLFDGYPIFLMKSIKNDRKLFVVNDAPGSCEVDAEILRSAYEAMNGNIYTIDTVMIPWKACSFRNTVTSDK
jgi:uncharacterized surface protein with fasciclin (FAS1) repeats